MKVLDSRIIVQVKHDEACTKIGDFVIPEGTNEYDTAEVIAVGPETKGCVPGDTVYVYRNAGREFKVDDITYKTITSSEVIVVL